MTTYYVGAGGSDTALGTSWETRLATLNGAEDAHGGGTPKSAIAAGDVVIVGPGVYRETLTIDVSGTAGNPITYIADYTGQSTDGVGGVVRITGSDNDQTATRNYCLNTSGAKNYRTFQGFVFDLTLSYEIYANSGSSYWVVDKCVFYTPPVANIYGAAFSSGGTNNTVSNCIFWGGFGGILFTHTSTIDNTANVIQNCIFHGCNLSGSGYAVRVDRVGGITAKNCTWLCCANAFRIGTALAAGQTETINNCIIFGCVTALSALNSGEITEDYNNLYANNTARTNVSTGANSIAVHPLFDPRPFLQLLHAGAGPSSVTQMVSPYDLASYSTLIDVAGTSPTTTDLRGTAVQGTQREFGALEYDSTLKKHGNATVGGVLINPGLSGGLR